MDVGGEARLRVALFAPLHMKRLVASGVLVGAEHNASRPPLLAVLRPLPAHVVRVELKLSRPDGLLSVDENKQLDLLAAALADLRRGNLTRSTTFLSSGEVIPRCCCVFSCLFCRVSADFIQLLMIISIIDSSTDCFSLSRAPSSFNEVVSQLVSDPSWSRESPPTKPSPL